MSWKLACGVLAVVLIGAVASVGLLPLSPQVSAQTSSRWEYKVVVFHHEGDYRTDPDGKKNAERFDQQFNDLTRAGWEYVGPVCNPSGYSRGFVAFRRATR